MLVFRNERALSCPNDITDKIELEQLEAVKNVTSLTEVRDNLKTRLVGKNLYQEIIIAFQKRSYVSNWTWNKCFSYQPAIYPSTTDTAVLAVELA